ncbi:MAG TPA: primosomal protein DnaI [Pseudogracilibacillus sp.]|nr:primosomal protein DnaI [Pseudogracilibacillus sp.]
MKPIKSSLQPWIEKNKDFQSRHEAMKQEILSHPHVKEFLQAHPELTAAQIDKRLNKLYEYITQSHQCDKCASFDQCVNMLQGYSPKLQYVQGDIHITYEKCHRRLQYEARTEESDLVRSVYMPKAILQANIKEVHIDEHRMTAIEKMMEFIKQSADGLPQKGLFLTGPFGVGKTYLLGAIANRLKENNLSSMLVYMPEFVREMKQAIQDKNVNEKIEAFQAYDVLMLDDIGAENMSAWFRDEVLGTILQHRMMEQLPVFFTSNYTMDQLEEILATSTKGEVEQVKAGRIMERIKEVSTEVHMSGDNRRGH